MWLEGPSQDEEWAAELEQGAAHRHVHAPPAPTHAAGAGLTSSSAPSPVPDDVEERLEAVAAEEGWDEAEVAALRAYLTPGAETEQDAAIGRPPPNAESRALASELELPGAAELDDAMAALAKPPAAPAPASATEHADVWPATDDLGPPDAPSEERLRAWVRPHERVVPRAPEPSDTSSEPTDPSAEPEPEWLRGRQDAAARAYRRLRRIFPAER